MIPQDLYTKLFDRIVKGTYSAGAWLREDTLAEEFGVSRTPVRDALRQLAQDGLVEVIPKRGSRSLGFTVDDLEEAFSIRRNLELLALERAIPILRLDRLMDMRGRIDSLTDDDDPRLHAALDNEFHTMIMEAADGKRLNMMLRSLYRIMASFRELGFLDAEVRRKARTEHLAIIESLIARDGETAATMLRRHVDATKNRVLSKVVRGEMETEANLAGDPTAGREPAAK
jgi:GntR family transcriptional regulator, rspAB operon transcriptional repressor